MNHASHYKLISSENIEKIGSKFWEENNQLFFNKVQIRSYAGFTRLDTRSQNWFPGIKITKINDPRAVYFKKKAEELGFYVGFDYPLTSDQGISIRVSWD